jgi:hypothetical protein
MKFTYIEMYLYAMALCKSSIRKEHNYEIYGNRVVATSKFMVIGYPTGIRTRYIHSHNSFLVALEGFPQTLDRSVKDTSQSEANSMGKSNLYKLRLRTGLLQRP